VDPNANASRPTEKKSESLTPIIAGCACAFFAALLLLAYKRRQDDQKMGNNALHESLLDNDGLELNELQASTAGAGMFSSANKDHRRHSSAVAPAAKVETLYPVVVAAAQPAAVCKVLITGESCADIRSIEVGARALIYELHVTLYAAACSLLAAIPL
jgi:hypothetical protein